MAAAWVAGGAGHKLKTVPSVPDSPADGGRGAGDLWEGDSRSCVTQFYSRAKESAGGRLL